MSDLMRLTDGMDTIDFAPAIGYDNPKEKREHVHIALDGTRFSYVYSRMERQEIPIVSMGSTDADLINGWWEFNNAVDFYPDYANTPGTFYSVDLVNEDQPLQMEPPFWADKYMGTIIVREV